MAGETPGRARPVHKTNFERRTKNTRVFEIIDTGYFQQTSTDNPPERRNDSGSEPDGKIEVREVRAVYRRAIEVQYGNPRHRWTSHFCHV